MIKKGLNRGVERLNNLLISEDKPPKPSSIKRGLTLEEVGKIMDINDPEKIQKDMEEFKKKMEDYDLHSGPFFG